MGRTGEDRFEVGEGKETVENSGETTVWREEGRDGGNRRPFAVGTGEPERGRTIFGGLVVCIMHSLKPLNPPFKKTCKKYLYNPLRFLEESALHYYCQGGLVSAEEGFKVAQCYSGHAVSCLRNTVWPLALVIPGTFR